MNHLRRTFVLSLCLSNVVLAGCASGEVTGSPVPPPPGVGSAAIAVEAVRIYLVDNANLTPSGLSALKFNQFQIAQRSRQELERHMQGLAFYLRKTLNPYQIEVTRASELRSNLRRASHSVIIEPRALSTSPSGSIVDVDITIRNQIARTVMWKGEATLSDGRESTQRVASGIERVLREQNLLVGANQD